MKFHYLCAGLRKLFPRHIRKERSVMLISKSHTLNKGYSYDLRLRTWHLQFHASWFNQADSTGLQES